MKHPLFAFIAVIFFLAVAPRTQAAALSTFDTDADGWTVNAEAHDLTWHSTGGSPGGFISASDNVTGVLWFFNAPSKFLGNQSDTFGLNLCFDLKQFGSGDIDDTTPPANVDLFLVSGTTILIYQGLPVPNTDPVAPPGSGTAFTHYEVTLSGSDPGWRRAILFPSPTDVDATDADFTAVLANVSNLQIKGEFRHEADQGSLDNVNLGCEEIPEPVTGVLVSLALFGVVWLKPARHNSPSN